MIFQLIIAAAFTLLQTESVAPTQGWTWTLYANGRPVVLANEVPDTPHLRTTLECAAGSGQVRLTQYQSGLTTPGPATLTSGRASTPVEVVAQGPRLQIQFRTSQPVFAAFVANGRLTVAVEDATSQVSLDSASLPHLRRFAELCTG